MKDVFASIKLNSNILSGFKGLALSKAAPDDLDSSPKYPPKEILDSLKSGNFSAWNKWKTEEAAGKTVVLGTLTIKNMDLSGNDPINLEGCIIDTLRINNSIASVNLKGATITNSYLSKSIINCSDFTGTNFGDNCNFYGNEFVNICYEEDKQHPYPKVVKDDFNQNKFGLQNVEIPHCAVAEYGELKALIIQKQEAIAEAIKVEKMSKVGKYYYKQLKNDGEVSRVNVQFGLGQGNNGAFGTFKSNFNLDNLSLEKNHSVVGGNLNGLVGHFEFVDISVNMNSSQVFAGGVGLGYVHKGLGVYGSVGFLQSSEEFKFDYGATDFQKEKYSYSRDGAGFKAGFEYWPNAVVGVTGSFIAPSNLGKTNVEIDQLSDTTMIKSFKSPYYGNIEVSIKTPLNWDPPVYITAGVNMTSVATGTLSVKDNSGIEISHKTLNNEVNLGVSFGVKVIVPNKSKDHTR
jgi:hypothetical protein